MEQLKIIGGQRLVGEVRVSGAKNAALPILAASLLTAEDLVLHNVPDLSDVRTMIKLLECMGVKVEREGTTVRLNAGNITSTKAPYELVKTMRASILTLCPLVARFGSAEVSLPGGCAIGARPVDQHIKGLRQLGANVEIEHGYINATATRLLGTRLFTDMVTVTGTENLLMAAVLAEGETIIDNAAREPEVIDLAKCLRAMGAQIEGEGSSEIRVQGVKTLHGAEHTVVADRIEAGTFLIMAAAAGERVIIQNIIPQHLESLISKLKEMGVKMENVGDSIIVYGDNKNFNAVDVRTQVYPGFATDLQQPLTALLTQANGQSQVIETIYPERFRHCEQLNKMGANIELDESMCFINGKTPLKGAKVEATDLRCGAALLIAGLIADGITEISNVYHIDRGYANIDQKLITLGAVIRRIKVDD